MTALDALGPDLDRLAADIAGMAGGPERSMAALLSQAAADLAARGQALATIADTLDAATADAAATLADLRARIAALPSPPPPPPAAAWDLGPVRAVVTVPDAPALAALLAGPVPLPGTHLCLAAGAYPGFSVPGSWQGVVVRSAVFSSAAGLADAPQAAVVTGNVTVAGPACTVAGLSLANTAAVDANVPSIRLAGAGSRASRNLVDTPRPLADGIDIAGNDCVVDGNEIRNFANMAICPLPGARRCYIGWNHLHHASAVAGRPNSRAGIMLGGNLAKVGVENPGGHLVEWNLVEDWVGVDGIEVKSADNVVRLNTLLGSAAGQCGISVRHGPRTLVVANHVENGQILLCDHDSVAVGNRTTGTRNAPRLRVKAGTISPEQFLASGGGGGQYPYSVGARVVLHDGAVEVGAKPNGTETLPALATALEACRGVVTVGLPGSDFVRTDTTAWADPVPNVRRLAPADVGPLAGRQVAP